MRPRDCLTGNLTCNTNMELKESMPNLWQEKIILTMVTPRKTLMLHLIVGINHGTVVTLTCTNATAMVYFTDPIWMIQSLIRESTLLKISEHGSSKLKKVLMVHSLIVMLIPSVAMSLKVNATSVGASQNQLKCPPPVPMKEKNACVMVTFSTVPNTMSKMKLKQTISTISSKIITPLTMQTTPRA